MASVHVLFQGYVGDRVAGTVSLVTDGDRIIVVDPGMVPERSRILAPMFELGVHPRMVTDIILSHHHPDHTLNVALFPERATVHDHWARYTNDVWDSRPAEGSQVSEHVRLIATPGHTPQDITTLVTTEAGTTVALTHLWWNGDIPGDPRAVDAAALRANRERVLELADTIVPGHGAPFAAADAPRWPEDATEPS